VDGKVNLDQAFGRIDEAWSPRIVAAINDFDVKLAKVEGTFVWHEHADTDEFFLVTEGELRIELDGREDVVLRPGELYVVPRGVRHRPSAEQPTRILLLEPRGTMNTGDADAPGTTGIALNASTGS
jgi:mannose-6-phosphate isomerase-like protein (cupin superfamily)